MPASPRVAAGLRIVALTGLVAIPLVLPAQQRREGDGYLLGRPAGSLTIRAGFAQPSASSTVFEFTSQHLTLDRGDFSSPTLGIEAGFLFRNRFEVLLGVGVASRTAHSNYRDFVDNDDREIRQATQFRRVPLTVGLKYYLTPLGRSLGSYAWVPARIAPYVAAGGGGVYYRFRQEGDFVDFQSLDVFTSTLESSGWAPTAYGAAGVGLALIPRASLVTEFRYDVARAPMAYQFEGFDKIDLSGASLTAGLQLRF